MSVWKISLNLNKLYIIKIYKFGMHWISVDDKWDNYRFVSIKDGRILYKRKDDDMDAGHSLFFEEKTMMKQDEILLQWARHLPRWLSIQITHSLLRTMNESRSVSEMSSFSQTVSIALAGGWRFGIVAKRGLFVLASINCLTHASFREILCCSFKTNGSLPDLKKAICPIFSKNCRTLSNVSTDVLEQSGEISTSGT